MEAVVNIEWKNERKKAKDLIPWDKNPRKITDEQLEHLKSSIAKFNYAAPIVCDADGRIVAGHMRCRALVALGRSDEEIDVRVASRQLTNEEFQELAIRDNANGGDWDMGALAADFDLEALSDWGFDPDKIDRLRVMVKEDGFDADAEVGRIQIPKTKRGDLYVLGNHRLLCGDSTVVTDYEKLMGGGKAHMIFTDPPYSVNYKSPTGKSYSLGGKYQSENAIFNDDKEPDEALNFYIDVLKNLYIFSTDDCAMYWWFANYINWINRLAWIQSGWRMSQVLVWLKETMIFSMGQDYHRCYEPCMFGWKDGKTRFTNKSIRNYRDCFMIDPVEFSDLPDVWYQNRDKTSEYVHPTQKPVRLAERALRKNSQTGDIVLDAFGGSGSTLMACEQMGRRCFTIEMDPKYCDAICLRYARFKGIDEKEVFNYRKSL